MAFKAKVRHWEPEQLVVPDGAMWLGGDSTTDVTRDLVGGPRRADWARGRAYPSTRRYTFSEVVTPPKAGHVLGVDTSACARQSPHNQPPAHAMAGLRLASAQRELVRTRSATS